MLARLTRCQACHTSEDFRHIHKLSKHNLVPGTRDAAFKRHVEINAPDRILQLPDRPQMDR